jgi:putative transposase
VPHQALGGAHPGDLYTPSARVYVPPGEPDYPFHDRTLRGTRYDRHCIRRRKINLSNVFAGQTVGICEVDDRIWLVSFMQYDRGFFDKDEDRVDPGPHPFTPDNVLTMCPEYTSIKMARPERLTRIA